MKDPSNPIIKKYFIKCPEVILLSKLLTNIPIKKEPRTFTKSVPNGKVGKKNLKIADKKYLREAPIAPPVTT